MTDKELVDDLNQERTQVQAQVRGHARKLKGAERLAGDHQRRLTEFQAKLDSLKEPPAAYWASHEGQLREECKKADAKREEVKSALEEAQARLDELHKAHEQGIKMGLIKPGS